MAHLELEGQRVEVAEDWRVGELIRAENALDIDMETAKMAGKTALVMFISLARVEPWKTMQPGTLADLVLRMELSTIGDQAEDDAGPPAEEPAPNLGDAGTDSETEEPQTAGPLRSVSTA